MRRLTDRFKIFNEKKYMRKILKIQYSEATISKCGNDYGGFNVVSYLLDTIQKVRRPIIYSFGIGEDLSFSEDMCAKWDCEIYAFDPTPKASQYVQKSELIKKETFHFYEYGLSDFDGTGKFYLPKDTVYVPENLVKGRKTEEVSGSLIGHEGVQNMIYVELKTLQTIMEEFGHRQIDLLKMDIEGSEFKVIENILHLNGGGGIVCPVMFRNT